MTEFECWPEKGIDYILKTLTVSKAVTAMECDWSRDPDPPHLHVVEDFQEGEGHSTTDDHLIHLVQHVIDQLNLIFHLRSGKQSETSVIDKDIYNMNINTPRTFSLIWPYQTNIYIPIYELRAILLISNYGNDKEFRVDELMEHVRVCWPGLQTQL